MASNREYAIEHLTTRLEDGKKVDGLTLSDLIESYLAGPDCKEAEEKVAAIFIAPAGERAARIDQFNAERIAAFLNNRREVVEETIADIIAAEEA